MQRKYIFLYKKKEYKKNGKREGRGIMYYKNKE